MLRRILSVFSLAALLLSSQAWAADTIKIGFNIPLTGDIPKVGEMSKQAAEMLKTTVRKFSYKAQKYGVAYKQYR